MSTTVTTPDRFAALPDEPALQATVAALEEHGFSVEVAGDLDAAREAVLARIPEGSSVMTHASVTLDQTGIADAINDGAGRWESPRNRPTAPARARGPTRCQPSPWAQCRSGGRDTVRCNSPARTPSGRHLTGHRLALIGQARSASSSSGLFSSPSYHWPPQPVLTT